MDYKAVGRRIRFVRKSLKLTQTELAELAGISVSFMGHIERGTRVLSAETLMRLAVQLKCSADFLLGIDKASEDSYVTALLHLREMMDNKLDVLLNPKPFQPLNSNEDFT